MAMSSNTWMTVSQIREALQFTTDDACRKWLRRLRVIGISRFPRGRKKIYARVDVERALTDARRRRLEQAEKTEVS